MIKIIRGVYGHIDGGRIIPKRPDDEPFSVDKKTEERLIEQKVAIHIDDAPTGITKSEEITVPSILPSEDVYYDEYMSFEKLKTVAAFLGEDIEIVNACKNKEAILSILDEKYPDKKRQDEDEGKDEIPPNVAARGQVSPLMPANSGVV